MSKRLTFAILVGLVFVAGCKSNAPARTVALSSPPVVKATTAPPEAPAIVRRPSPAQPSVTRLRSILEALAGEVRGGGSPAERRAATMLADQLRSMGYKPRMHRVPLPGGPSSRNVYAVSGSGEKPLLIIGAHYDSKAPNSPGAIDNASGVAVLMEVARCLRDQQLDIKVAFVAFGAEERLVPKGGHHFGSKHYVRKLLKHVRKDEIVGMINIDMACGDQLYVGAMDLGSPLLATAVAEARALDLDFITEKEKALSDHEAFERRGIPSAYFHYWPAKNGAYHNAKDLPELVDYEQVRGVAQLVINTVLATDREIRRRGGDESGSSPRKPRQ